MKCVFCILHIINDPKISRTGVNPFRETLVRFELVFRPTFHPVEVIKPSV
jgi:hypothetical protein